MRNDGAIHPGATRIHAIILTRDRPCALKRCVGTALSALTREDALTVVDDSSAMASCEVVALLGDVAHNSISHVSRLQAEQLHDAIARALGRPRVPWQSRVAPRDIAPLRNLSLLISAAVDARTTVLIDDDVCGFNLDETHHMLDAVDPMPGGVVAGARIGGITEQDTVTRLSAAMQLLETRASTTVTCTEDLFRMPQNDDDCCGDSYGCVSAGYLAFRLRPASLFAFPPGYNEDWLWCLLHRAARDTRVSRADETVVHDPPFLRRSSREDILFELTGDFVLDCLAACDYATSRRPDAVLMDLAQHAPNPSVLPSVRAEMVLEQSRHLSEHVLHLLSELGDFGLCTLRDMQRSGELEMDGNKALSDWSSGAAVKHASFASTLKTSSVNVAIREMMQKGRV